LKHTRAIKDQPLRNEIQRDHLQEQHSHRHRFGILGKAAKQQSWLPLCKDCKSDHDGRAYQRNLPEGFLHAPAIAGAKVLSRDRPAGKCDRHRRHLNETKHARPDAEARLGRGTELP
jgi:hypothetical protein